MTTASRIHRSRVLPRGTGLLLVALIGLSFSGVVSAGEEAPAWLETPAETSFTGAEAPLAGGEAEGGAEATSPDAWFRKPQQEMNLRELQAYQAFYYSAGGRDPFFYTKPIVRDEGEMSLGEQTVIAPPAPPPPTAEEKFNYLVKQKVRIELLLLLHDYDQAMTVCSEVRNTVEADWGGAPTEPENNRLWRQVLSYQKTARRLKQARETRQEFEGANLDIGGIRWTPTDQAALINDRIYEPGEVLEQPIGGERVQVESIDEDSVVFIFKGRRFRRWIDMADGSVGVDR